MIRTFLTTQAGATFHETSPRFTMLVRKETVEVIYRVVMLIQPPFPAWKDGLGELWCGK